MFNPHRLNNSASTALPRRTKLLTHLAIPCVILVLGGCDMIGGQNELSKEQVAALPPLKLTVLSETPTYPMHSFANAIDGDPNNNYVAGIENEVQAVVELGVDMPASPVELLVTWNAPDQFSRKVVVYGRSKTGEKETLIGDAKVNPGLTTHIPLKSLSKYQSIRIVFSDFSGQPRVLVRLLELR